MIPANCPWARQSPYERYFDFIAPGADRYRLLLEQINFLKLNSAVIPVAGNRHIIIFPPEQKPIRATGGVFPFRGMNPFMLVAHYDRVQGSPGANDNSIAVFHLLRAALLLAQRGIDQWIIVFTDKEELVQGEGIEAQGSFTLAEKMKSWGLVKARIFNFDACGAGDTFILSTTTDLILNKSEKPNISNIKKNIAALRDRALVTARHLRLDKVLLAPTPFCDDMGFLRAGLAAQTVTMLPGEEAARYKSLLSSRPEFADLLISGEIKDSKERSLIPETWQSLNKSTDTYQRLTPEFFEQVVLFAVELCRERP